MRQHTGAKHVSKQQYTRHSFPVTSTKPTSPETLVHENSRSAAWKHRPTGDNCAVFYCSPGGVIISLFARVRRHRSANNHRQASRLWPGHVTESISGTNCDVTVWFSGRLFGILHSLLMMWHLGVAYVWVQYCTSCCVLVVCVGFCWSGWSSTAATSGEWSAVKNPAIYSSARQLVFSHHYFFISIIFFNQY